MLVILDAAAAAAAIAADASVVCVVAGAIADTASDVAVVVVKMGLDDDDDVVVVVLVFTVLESIGAEAADTAMDDVEMLSAGTGTVEEDVVGKSCDKGGNSSCCK